MKNILSAGSTNAKTAKNIRPSVILYLAPLAQNSKGINLCPKASTGCAAACLFTAGRGAFSNVKNSRIARTEYYLINRPEFLGQILTEINKAAAKVTELAVRLNGTSDAKIVEQLCQYSIFNGIAIAPNVIFYDYTKIYQKAGRKELPTGHTYTVTFSRSEVNETEALQVLNSGGIVAAVFNTLPEYWNGFKVYDGDERDDIMLDITGPAVLGLKAKGQARKDTTGFVIK